MGLLSRIQQFLTDINHLGVGDDQDIALPHYDPGTLHGRQVRQASGSNFVPGFNHSQVDCATGIIQREGDRSLYYPGLKGITGCYSDGVYLDTNYDGYETISYVGTTLQVKACKVQPDRITVNDTITFECKTEQIGFGGSFEEMVKELADKGYRNGTCHPDNVEKKLNEFACMERERCYSVTPPHGTCTDDLPTASPTGTDYQATNVTNMSTPPTKDDKAGFISNADAPSNLGYLGFLVAPIGLGIVAASLGVYAAYRWWTRSERPEPNEPTEIPMSEIQIKKGADIPPEEITLPKHKAYNPYAQ